MAKRPTGGKTARKKSTKKSAVQAPAPEARNYTHPEATAPLRPDVGVQAQFRKKKPPKHYRYDSSLSPALEWDEQPARAQGEALLARILEAGSLDEAKAAAEQLRAMSGPFLNWAGKAERQVFGVPTLPLFVHERLSTKAILETVKRHSKDQQVAFDLFGDPKRDLADHVLRAYEHRDRWVNRMILGDSLVVMNSLLEYEGMGGQVQMIYIDPPYGVKFGSNFQPFVRKRDVTHGDDEDFTREPETVQAYRDTWELGLHSWLTYLRDRLLTARDLLAPSGSVFVQISEENIHHVRELLSEVFGSQNAVVTIIFKKKSSTETTEAVNDYILWFAKDRSRLKVHPLAQRRTRPEDDPKFNSLIDSKANVVRVTDLDDDRIEELLADGYEFCRVNYPLVSQHYSEERSKDFVWNGKAFRCGLDKQWRYDLREGFPRLAAAGRLFDGGGASLGGVVRWSDWPYVYVSNVWTDIHGEKRPIYVVQTAWKAVQRCILMTTDPGDLILDPTCGSGTTAYVSEQWGRRWITIDTSRVPLALARQRLLTASYAWHELQDESRGPAGGFVYRRRQNSNGAEVGGIAPHLTLKSIAHDEPPAEEVLVDRPEETRGITRVAGPFVFEATIPTPVDYEGDGEEDSGAADGYADFVDRMVEVLRRSPDLRLPGNVSVRLEQVRRPAKTLSLSAEATVAGKPVAVVFGPENGAVSQKLVYNAGSEARAKGYSHLFVFGFEIEPSARTLVDQAESALGIPGTYVAATPDLVLGDLLKTMRSSQVFSVCGLPEVKVEKAKTPKGEPQQFQVSLLGLDTFDPATMELDHKAGEMVPAWFLDTDYDPTRCFRVCQAFFPKTGAWDNLRRELRAEYDESLWDHLAGTSSALFEAGEQRQIAVKVIDERGNELLVVKPLPQ